MACRERPPSLARPRRAAKEVRRWSPHDAQTWTRARRRSARPGGRARAWRATRREASRAARPRARSHRGARGRSPGRPHRETHPARACNAPPAGARARKAPARTRRSTGGAAAAARRAPRSAAGLAPAVPAPSLPAPRGPCAGPPGSGATSAARRPAWCVQPAACDRWSRRLGAASATAPVVACLRPSSRPAPHASRSGAGHARPRALQELSPAPKRQCQALSAAVVPACCSARGAQRARRAAARAALRHSRGAGTGRKRCWRRPRGKERGRAFSLVKHEVGGAQVGAERVVASESVRRV